jgi:hypothetical protein
MTFRRILAALATACVLGAPAMAFAATAAAPRATAAARKRAAVHRLAVRHNLRLAATYAHRAGHRLSPVYASAAWRRPTAELQRSNARLRARLRTLRFAVPAGLAGVLARIATCESHRNPRAIGGGGLYRGAYQMTFAAWRRVGGHGDPARASMAEQTHRAALLYRRAGAGQWPVCGR